MNKTELNLMEKLLGASMEFKMEAYRLLGEDLQKIKEQLENLLGQHAEPKYVAPVVTKTEDEETKAELHAIKEMISNLENENTELKKRLEQAKEEKTEIKKESDVVKSPKVNHKVSDVKKLINCGASEGENEVLFVEKRRDSKHLWFGQIRISGYIRNFHWSNELSMPVVYGVQHTKDLEECRRLIRQKIESIMPGETIKYDEVPNDPDFGGFHARQFIGAIDQGAYIYLSPAAHEEDTKDTDIIAKGYVAQHGFIVRKDGEVYWRHYNYIFSKKPFEKTPSKGFDAEQMQKDVQILFDAVCNQFDKFKAAYEKTEAKKQNEIPEEDVYTQDTSGLF